MNLIIDEGNTRIKLAVFENSQLIDLVVCNVKLCKNNVEKLLTSYSINAIIYSSVTDEINDVINHIDIPYKVCLSDETPLPFKNLYQTPKTLGVDRLALVTAASHHYYQENCLVIDAGTCVTYDFINKQNEYLGGAIAPGLQMRFKSMHVFTKKLPDIEVPSKSIEVIGKTTKHAMESGVLNGMVFEIDGVINYYRQKFKDLNVILTGGDANSLCKQLKNSIFVNPNFLLEGLNAVLTYQNKNETKLK